MNIVKKLDNQCSITEEQYTDIQEAVQNIGALLDIMYDYCDYNAENVKINPLITLIEQMQSEKRKITSKF